MEAVQNTQSFDRPKAFKIFFIIVVVVAFASGVYWWIHSRHFQTTDDAYVAGTQVQLTAQSTGTISSVNISETQHVLAGDVLFNIEQTDEQLAVDQADAELLQALRSARVAILTAIQRKQDLDKSTIDYQRRLALKGDASLTKDEMDRVRLQLQTSQIAYQSALELADQLTAVTDAPKHTDVVKAAANVKQRYIALLRTAVISPVSGTVAKRNAHIGQRVAPGAMLAWLVADERIWIDANFKEDQLAGMRIGQPVEMEADVYGSKVVYHGQVAGFSPGTGATLGLLPPQNASGNWVKVVQRLPVRIQLDPQELKEHPLNIGLSIFVKVDTANKDGLALQAMKTDQSLTTDVYQTRLAQADLHVQQLLARAQKR